MLTPEQIDNAYRDVWSTVPHARRLTAFARAIEAEVRKEDEALIRQMLEALQRCTKYDDRDYEAVIAARARLGEKEPT